MKPSAKNRGELFTEKVEREERQKMKALNEKKRSIWFGLGMFGIVGWSVAVPSLVGAFVGLWLDKVYRQSFSWSLSLLVVGLLIGCVIAWYWIAKENREMHQTENDNDE
ncbi:MAG: AtpZ/AtpI family protein [Ginsengibacter sp.]